jgi:hypothetical protein
MDNIRPIDIARDSGGAADIGTEEEGAVVEMIEVDGAFIIVKERAMYEFMLADKVDPKRENPKLALHIQQRILDRGSEDEIVCKTFLTGKRLFNKNRYPETINCKEALALSLEAAKELVALENEIKSYLAVEDAAVKDYDAKKGRSTAYAIPSISDVNTRCKAIFQKADHCTQVLMEIITHFYPDTGLTKQSHFPRFQEVLKTKYGEDDNFVKYIGECLPFLELVRAIRNCLDHRLSGTTIKDFGIQPDSTVLTPTIEVDFRGSILKRTALSEVLPIVRANLTDIFENVIAYLADKNVEEDMMKWQLAGIPEDKRRNKFIRYCFWAPLGDGGFFDQ